MANEVWKNPAVARAFIGERSRLIPDRSRQTEVLLRLLRSTTRPIRRVLDLGAGDGILLATVLEAHPEAEGFAVDFSPPMLEQARAALAVFGARAAVVAADLADPAWAMSVEGPFDAVVSGYAIHHLSDERKRALYAEVFSLLNEGGAFVNCEHVASPTPALQRMFEEAMSEHLCERRRERGEDVTPEQVYREYVARPDREANILAPVEEQCRWLREIGYREVDCFWKYFELAVFGGIR
jgi:tRNA (cmo5U34)-methyltransferase